MLVKMTCVRAGTSSNRLRHLGVGLLVAVVVLSLPVGFVGSTAAAGDTAVEIGPETQTIDAGTTSTVAINVTNADGGVGAYGFTLNTSATDTLTITDVELAGNPAQSNVEIASDGSGVTVSAVFADTADTGSVSIATVTIQGETAGTTDLTLSNLEVGDEDGNPYTITSTGDASVDVRESTTVQNATLSPASVDSGETVSQSLSFDALKMSSDGNTDSFTLTAPADVTLAEPTVTLTDADGQSIALESGPTLQDAGDGTDNQLVFAIASGNAFNTSAVAADVDWTATYPTVSTNQSREFDIAVADSSGETAAKTVTTAVQTTASGGDGATNQTVSLTPTDQNISVSESTTLDLEVASVTNGVGAYDFSISVTNSSQARIAEIGLGGDPGITDISLADDGSSVTAFAVGADTADTGTVSIATVTLVGVNPGTVNVTPTVRDIGDENGNSLTIADVSGASVTVEAGPGDVTGNGNPAQDLDGDGLYEDVNGDGAATISDVQAFFTTRDSAVVQSNTAAFDFNGDGNISISDVQSLFTRVT
jgi:hypothetical protein